MSKPLGPEMNMQTEQRLFHDAEVQTEQRLFHDAEVQTEAEQKIWRAHVERVNDARLAKGHIRRTAPRSLDPITLVLTLIVVGVIAIYATGPAWLDRLVEATL